MKRYFKFTILPIALSLMATVNTGCLEEAFPEDGSISATQISEGGAIEGLALAMPAYFNAGGSESFDIGFVGFQIFMDAMTADYPTNNETMDYFRYFNTQISIGNIGVSQNWWVRYYYLIQKANSVIKNSNPDVDLNGQNSFFLGAGYVFRAYSYLDMARFFEYKHTNVARLDNIADERGLWGLTVPIITEKTTEMESRRTPRAPFYEMYRFIYTDLLAAEKYLQNHHAAVSKDMPCLGVVYGIQARMWLELGTRFSLYPEYLAMQIENENNPELEKYQKLGIASAVDCFAKAAEYAQKAIGEGFTPLSKSQWFDTSTGFNTPNNSWLWAIVLPSSDASVNNTWKSIPSFKSPEATYGMSYGSGIYRMIDARLFGKIDANDWRRTTWIDPAFTDMEDEDEKKEEFNNTYARNTTLDYESFCNFNAYTGFKFRPASGNGQTPSVGNVVDMPLMRIEEMYLIEAEAIARCQGAAAGKTAIESFMNTYRMEEGTTFTCPSAQLDDVIDVIWTQKRIELWGEGQVFWDYKRRELPIERGYPGTNHPSAYRYNSYPLAVAPWTNFYIPDRVQTTNPTVVLNPDPNQAISTLWTE